MSMSSGGKSSGGNQPSNLSPDQQNQIQNQTGNFTGGLNMTPNNMYGTTPQVGNQPPQQQPGGVPQVGNQTPQVGSPGIGGNLTQQQRDYFDYKKNNPQSSYYDYLSFGPNAQPGDQLSFDQRQSMLGLKPVYGNTPPMATVSPEILGYQTEAGDYLDLEGNSMAPPSSMPNLNSPIPSNYAGLGDVALSRLGWKPGSPLPAPDVLQKAIADVRQGGFAGLMQPTPALPPQVAQPAPAARLNPFVKPPQAQVGKTILRAPTQQQLQARQAQQPVRRPAPVAQPRVAPQPAPVRRPSVQPPLMPGRPMRRR
jgi:hypothetical protein